MLSKTFQVAAIIEKLPLAWKDFKNYLKHKRNEMSIRGGKIGPAWWASPVCPKLGPGWAIKFLARKKPGQIWPAPARPNFFCLEMTIWPDRPDF